MPDLKASKYDSETMSMFKRALDHQAWFVRMSSPGVPAMQHLIWKKPHSNMDSLRFVIHGSMLVAYGDLYEAVYRFNGEITFPWLAGSSLDYFCEKCRASFDSVNGLRWSQDKAFEIMHERLVSQAADSERYESASELVNDLGSTVTCLGAVYEECFSQHQFASMLNDNPDIFGDDISEMTSVGHSVGREVRMHLLALHYAAQLIVDTCWTPRKKALNCTDEEKARGGIPEGGPHSVAFTPSLVQPAFALPDDYEWVTHQTPGWLTDNPQLDRPPTAAKPDPICPRCNAIGKACPAHDIENLMAPKSSP